MYINKYIYIYVGVKPAFSNSSTLFYFLVNWPSAGDTFSMSLLKINADHKHLAVGELIICDIFKLNIYAFYRFFSSPFLPFSSLVLLTSSASFRFSLRVPQALICIYFVLFRITKTKVYFAIKFKVSEATDG